MNTTAYEKIDQYLSESPINIEAIIREFDIELNKKANLGDDVSGQIELLGEGQYKISVNKKDHYFRQRFTMAHELGHYIFHRHLLGDGVDDSRMYRTTSNSNFHNQIGPKQEAEANEFAAKILMPFDALLKDYNSMEQNVNEVAKKWQVSPQALKIRLGI